jgi:acetate kinase
MNTLVLIPGRKSLRYAGFVAGSETCTGTIRGFRWQGPRVALDEVHAIAQATGLLDDSTRIMVHSLFGGEEFPNPVSLDDDALARLQRVARQSPLHVAHLLELAQTLPVSFPGIPVSLAFETSFFVDLPARERLYAVSADLSDKLSLRRWGYHGLLHEPACRQAARKLRKQGLAHAPRILSICLDPQPEIAGVVGRRPVTVTSGATPLEGLPGETNCGEIDPAVALALAGEAGLGPEGTNALLTGESGLSGLVGRRVRLDEVLTNLRSELVQARAVLQYRILMAAGAAAAAMGGVDGLVFSGRYATCAAVVANELLPRLELAGALPTQTGQWEIFAKPLEGVLADIATTMAQSTLSAQ